MTLLATVTTVLAVLATVIAGAGLLQAAIGWWAVRRYSRLGRSTDGALLPAITILKPLHGDEPMLEQALASFCDQDYPAFQIVFGLQDAADPALHVIRRLRARFPALDIAVVIDPAQHGVNRKISNLINMFPQAKHDTIVMADSDIHAPRDYLRQLAAELDRPGVGLVTTLYAGLVASPAFAARLGATQINHSFLPGALLARFLGREDCLGATMALRRDVLATIGGLQALVHHLADDAVLGRLVTGLGYRVALARTLPATTVPEMRPLPPVCARASVGPHDPVAGAGGVRPVRPAIPAVLGGRRGGRLRRGALDGRGVRDHLAGPRGRDGGRRRDAGTCHGDADLALAIP